MRSNSRLIDWISGSNSAGTRGRDRLQVIGVARLELLCQHADRAQRAAHAGCQDSEQDRQHQQPRQQLAQQQVAQDLFALLGELAHGDDHALGRAQIEHAPRLPGVVELLEALALRRIRQGGALAIDEQALALRVPHRDRHVGEVGTAAFARRRDQSPLLRRKALGQQGQDLLREAHLLGVEQLVDLEARAPAAEADRGQPDRRRPEQQEQQQAALQRHAVGPPSASPSA